MALNHTVLEGELIKRLPLRYTPAGVPVLEAMVVGWSRQMEAGMPRQVECRLKAVVVGDLAVTLSAPVEDPRGSFVGFLANRSRRAVQVDFHITEFTATN